MRIDQRHHNSKPAGLGEVITLYGLSIVFLSLIALELLSDYEPRKMAALFFLLWWVPLVFLHEFGHALMARLLGWHIQRTVIGFGRVIMRGSLFKAPLELRLLPIEGFVQMAPGSGKTTRSQQAWIYFAGPGIELLLFLVVIFGMGTQEFFRIEDDYGKLALQSLAYAALTGAVLNLLPMSIVTREGETPNDGMGILKCLFSKNP